MDTRFPLGNGNARVQVLELSYAENYFPFTQFFGHKAVYVCAVSGMEWNDNDRFYSKHISVCGSGLSGSEMLVCEFINQELDLEQRVKRVCLDT